MATIVIGGIVFLAAALSIRKIYVDKKNGKGCSGCCNSCTGCGNVKKKRN